MNYEKLKFELTDGVCVLTLNDPATLNAAGAGVMADLGDAIIKISTGEIAARCVVITGEGRGFCSGANLTERAARPGESLIDPNEDRLATVMNPFIRALRDLPVPLITAVNGVAAGIGSSFALMGDLIVASEDAYFLQAFRRIGLVPDGGATWMLPRALGKARAMELILLGEKLPAATALEWGLINRVVPAADLMPTAMALARQVATGPASLGMMRHLVWEGLNQSHEASLEAEAHMQRRAAETDDHKEGIAAFRDKRAAAFAGR